MPEAVGTPGANGRVLIVVALVVIIVVMPIPISVQPIADVILKFLEKRVKKDGIKDTISQSTSYWWCFSDSFIVIQQWMTPIE